MSSVYTTVLADPGWKYDDNLTMSATNRRGATSRYATMSTPDICALAASSHADARKPGLSIAGHEIADDAFLWLWVTNPFLLGGDGVRVCEAWGFEPKQIIPWVKGRIVVENVHDAPGYLKGRLICRTGLGHYTRGVTEHLILGTRGKATKLVKYKGENGLIVAPEEAFILEPPSVHSRKPEEQYAKIERVCPGPYLEMFATKRRAGWTSWGDALPLELEEAVANEHGA